jgi:transcription antitermination factor NusG
MSAISPAGILFAVRHHEADALQAIERLAVEAYLPVEVRWARRGRRRRIVRPLFGSYLFARFDRARDEWWRIPRLAFVDRVICANGAPAWIPDRQIDVVRMAEATGVYDLTRRHALDIDPEFPAGSKVRIIGGPFIGLIAEVRRATPKRRVEILFSMLGRQTIAQVERAMVAPA